MRVSLTLSIAVVCILLVSLVSAQDATKVDPKHYTVMSENAEVRVLKVHYGPHEKSVMHSHPDAVAVFLTDGKTQFTSADGKKDERSWKAGDAMFTPASTHLPENLTDKPMELVLVELKGKANHSAKMEKK